MSSSISRRTLMRAGLVLPLLACERVRVQAPFDMPPIVVPDFAQAPRFPITDFGASQIDQGKTSAAIARAIAAANAAGFDNRSPEA